jgi:carbonic anhydrase
MVDISTVGQLIIKEMGNLGVKKIEVIGHKKSHRVEISLECDPEAYPVVLNRLSGFVTELNDPAKLTEHLKQIQDKMESVNTENAQ